MKSIIQTRDECWECHTTIGLHRHEVFYGTANRCKSLQDGLTVKLCGYHHNLSQEGVHFNKELDLKLKRLGQIVWEEYYKKSTDDFINRYGKNYLIGGDYGKENSDE